MKKMTTGIAALLMGTAPALAGGIERAPQSLAALFEPGNYAELSFGGADPTVSGTDAAGFDTGDVAQGYGFVGLAYKQEVSPNVSFGVIVEQPFGADVRYPDGPPAGSGSPVLGGTAARVDSTTVTALARYRMDNNISFHGGIRASRADAEVTLSGAGYGDISGYNVRMDPSWGTGYVIGAAYEIPDIAARISLTYNSKITHDFDTRENILPGAVTTTEVNTPRSITLEGQTGVAADTLVFGSIRWVKWSEFQVRPAEFSSLPGLSAGLVSLEDTTTYTLGVGRRFTDNWSGLAAFVYEPTGDDLVSPLAPTNGRKGVTLAAIYTMDNIKITTGINYSKLGDARPQTGGAPRAQMEDSDLWGIGVRVGYSF
ncbi:OmpP1/FadL family transporter [Paracoccus tibetensis]|uniref:Long-chain fatty acid transport protein n=1 Tax=Paracoccus tibetensis TaxID=336292 RepID=A0A1G5D4J6_9RHOB|nr:outer membrane protein transport protein [Paracoccus tibetensis]SCY09574.1 Long-chain fatty acid transport protein [Paracoccus tibetensis]